MTVYVQYDPTTADPITKIVTGVAVVIRQDPQVVGNTLQMVLPDGTNTTNIAIDTSTPTHKIIPAPVQTASVA